MASLLSKINNDLSVALKAREGLTVSTLRFLISKIHNAQIAKGEELTDGEVVSEITKEVRRHKESIEAFEKGQRSELAMREKAELEILAKYLPRQLSDKQIRRLVDEAIGEVGAQGLSDVGRVMSVVMAKISGQADGAEVLAIVREKLSR